MPQRIVLVGGGHTHLHVVEQWAERPIRRAELVLVSPFERATYSGMLPGVLAGQYQPHEMEIDLPDFCEWAGARFLHRRAVGLDPRARMISLAGGRDDPLAFDIASINIGSQPELPEGCERTFACVPIKPMQTFLDRLKQKLDSALALSRTGPDPSLPLEISVIGGGAAGFEIACCLDQRLTASNVNRRITLFHAGEEILAGSAPRAIRLAKAALERRGVSVQTNCRVVRTESRGGHAVLILDDGREVRTDLALIATKASAPADLSGFRLPKTERGFLAVRPTLQTTADLPAFVVGDTAEIVDNPVPKAGVYAVRQGPVLWDNLQRMARRESLRPYRPQRRFLSLLNTGDGRAILQYHRLALHTRWAWWWKDRIDRKFLRRFRPG